MEEAIAGGHGALDDILNQAKRNSLELERRRSTDMERRPSAAGRRSMEAGRLSAEARRSSVESRPSAASGTTTVRAPKGEAKGNCPKGHPMFARTGGREVPCCSACFKRKSFAYGCEQCNFWKCDDCLIGYERRKKKKEEAVKKEEEREKVKKASCFSCFGRPIRGADTAADATQPGKQHEGTSQMDV